MLNRSIPKRLKFYPQVQLGNSANAFCPVSVDSTSTSSSSSPALLVSDIADLRKRLDWRLWNAMAEKDWMRWQKVIALYKDHHLELDEVSYSLVLHGYLLSHHHPSSTALLVLEEMKENPAIHSSVVSLNENLLNSYFELSDMGIRSSANGWQNLARLAWMCGARIRKKRMQRVRAHLDSLPTREVLVMTEDDVKRLIQSEHALAHAMIDAGDHVDGEGDMELLSH